MVHNGSYSTGARHLHRELLHRVDAVPLDEVEHLAALAAGDEIGERRLEDRLCRNASGEVGVPGPECLEHLDREETGLCDAERAGRGLPEPRTPALLDGSVLVQRLLSCAGAEALLSLPPQWTSALLSLMHDAATATATAAAAAAAGVSERGRLAEARGVTT